MGEESRLAVKGHWGQVVGGGRWGRRRSRSRPRGGQGRAEEVQKEDSNLKLDRPTSLAESCSVMQRSEMWDFLRGRKTEGRFGGFGGLATATRVRRFS